MDRRRAVAIALGAGAALSVVLRRHVRGRRVPGGILVADPGLYDALSHSFLLRSLLGGIAKDIASVAPDGGKVLDVGCGPGRLAILLAREGLEVTGLDLDPGMIERARANTASPDLPPSFLVGDVVAIPFPDETFDLVVSTLSMHHWADPAAGLAEIARVLGPGGRALIWDFRRDRIPLHGSLPDPAVHAGASPLVLEAATEWRWPWRFSLLQRVELRHLPTSEA